MLNMDFSTLKTECCFLIVFILYALISKFGRLFNALHAKKWFDVFYPFLTLQFVQVGIEKDDPMPLRSLNPAYFISYATGRIHIKSLHMQFKLKMRQNLISLIKQSVISFLTDKPLPKDRLYMDMVVADDVFDDCVFAVVHKAQMRWLRETCYHLSFTRILETPLLPETYVVMTEFSEIMSILLEDNLPFTQAIAALNAELEYFIVSDQPAKRPKSIDQIGKKTVTLCIKLPSLKHSDQVLAVVTQCIAFVDMLIERAQWRSNLTQKLKASREEAIRKLKKHEEEEILAKMLKKKAEKDKQEKERIRRLSSQEQRKYLSREREQKYRKQMKIIKM